MAEIQTPDVAPAEIDEIPALTATALIEAGVHFGHSARNWNPRMKPFIFGKKNGIHVINVKDTLRGAVRARYFLKQIASAGFNILIVGTKKQAAETVRAEAVRCEMPFVATRWLGGTLTNHATIRQRLKRLQEIEDLKDSGRFERSSKKMQSVIEREHRKIAFNLEGLRVLDRLPSALLVVDVRHEKNAVAEARKLNIPVVGIVDTDSDPGAVDIPVPANDDSLRGVQILLHYIVDGIIEGARAFSEGAGVKDTSGLAYSAYDELGPTQREKRRQTKGGPRGDRPQRGGGGGRSRPSGSRTESTEGTVDASVQEAVATANEQVSASRAAVRIKPKRADDAPAAPADAPAAAE